jgi:hypothetical protein
VAGLTGGAVGDIGQVRERQQVGRYAFATAATERGIDIALKKMEAFLVQSWFAAHGASGILGHFDKFDGDMIHRRNSEWCEAPGLLPIAAGLGQRKPSASALVGVRSGMRKNVAPGVGRFKSVSLRKECHRHDLGKTARSMENSEEFPGWERLR